MDKQKGEQYDGKELAGHQESFLPARELNPVSAHAASYKPGSQPGIWYRDYDESQVGTHVPTTPVVSRNCHGTTAWSGGAGWVGGGLTWASQATKPVAQPLGPGPGTSGAFVWRETGIAYLEGLCCANKISTLDCPIRRSQGRATSANAWNPLHLRSHPQNLTRLRKCGDAAASRPGQVAWPSATYVRANRASPVSEPARAGMGLLAQPGMLCTSKLAEPPSTLLPKKGQSKSAISFTQFPPRTTGHMQTSWLLRSNDR